MRLLTPKHRCNIYTTTRSNCPIKLAPEPLPRSHHCCCRCLPRRQQIQNGHCGPWRPGRDVEVAASPQFMRGCVDLGVVTFKASLLEDTGLRFVVDRLRATPRAPDVSALFTGMEALFYADGTLFDKLFRWLRDAGSVHKAVLIRRALFVHQ